MAARKHYDAHAFWILTGSAVRIGQRLGIHRDGSSHNLSPFDTEMRRRVWWQIVFLDGFAAKLCGAGFPAVSSGVLGQNPQCHIHLNCISGFILAFLE